jgi:maltooligosyltrehalose trehalohydrolase
MANNYRPTFLALQEITKKVYEYSLQYNRFKDASRSRIIQIAEDLNQGSYQLSDIAKSAINGCWEESLYHKSTNMTKCNCLDGSYLNELLMKDVRWNGFTGTKNIGTDSIPVSPIFYNNCHDKSYLQYRIERQEEWENTDFYNFPSEIDKLQWFKSQPYAIALLTCVGTPMIWHGEEFAESYGLPEGGPGKNDSLRVRGARFLHWYNFYTPRTTLTDETVLPLTTLYRNLCDLRKKIEALRGPRSNAVKEIEDFNRKLIVYRRWLNKQILVIAVNFSEVDCQVDIPFGHTGVWEDNLDKYYHPATTYKVNVGGSLWESVSIPSNFGRIFLLK